MAPQSEGAILSGGSRLRDRSGRAFVVPVHHDFSNAVVGWRDWHSSRCDNPTQIQQARTSLPIPLFGVGTHISECKIARELSAWTSV